MEKREYQAPLTERLYVATTSHLLDWSAPKDEGGTNIPEAKRYDFDAEDEFQWGNLWKDEWKDQLDDNLKDLL